MRKTQSIVVIPMLISFLLLVNINIIPEFTSIANAEDVWLGATRLSELGNSSLQPQVAAYGDNVHVVWSDDKTGDYEIYYRRSTNSGMTWDAEIRLTFNSSDQTDPEIAVWENNVHVIWESGYINSSDNGKTWAIPSNPFDGMDMWDIDIGVHQNKVYLAVVNYSYRFSNPPWIEEYWKYVVFKEISWSDWVILDTETEYSLYFSEIGLTVKNNDVHVIYGIGHHVILDCFNHTYSTAGGSPGSWSTPETVAQGSTDTIMGISVYHDGSTVRAAWCFSDSGYDSGVYTKVWSVTWYSQTHLGGYPWGHTSVAGNYVTWDFGDGDPIENNVDGQILISSGHPVGEIWHDTYLDNGTIHLVYIHENEIFYMRKANWPDLQLDGIIEFLPSPMIEIGSSVQINALIDNTGFSLNGVLVRFYNGNPDSDFDGVPDPSAIIIGNDTIDIGEGASEMVSINWTPSAKGFFEIYMWIDPNNEIIEKDDSNNLHMNLLQVISQRPLPPSNLRARLSPGDITDVELIWGHSLDDGGGENDVLGYNVYRSISGVNGNYAYLASVPADGSLTYSWVDVDAGDDDLNDYFYYIKAYDGESEGGPTNKAGKIAIPLEVGWNVFSIPLNQMDNSSDIVFQSIVSNYSAIQGYHAGMSTPWVHWHDDKPNYFSDEISINLENGYFMKMRNADNLIVAGSVPKSVNLSLNVGWNLVGYPSLTNHNRTNGLNNLVYGTEVNAIQWFNSTSKIWDFLEEDDSFTVDGGYWIHAKTDCIWEVPL